MKPTTRDLRDAVTGQGSAGVGQCPTGRPPRPYDPAVAADILARAKSGMPLKTATQGRVHFSVVLRWMEENDAFAVSLQKADADEQVRLLAAMEVAGPGKWQVYAWKLERLWPHIYGQKAQVHVETTHKLQVDENVCATIAENWAKLEAARIARAQPVIEAEVISDSERQGVSDTDGQRPD